MAYHALTRRDALGLIGRAAAGTFISGCSLGPTGAAPTHLGPRLSARPGAPTILETPGTRIFQVPGSNAVIHIPASVDRSQPTGLQVFLHGAMRTVEFFVDGHRPWADEAGVIFLAPYSGGGTWDAIRGYFSRDVAILDACLRWTFDRFRIDPARLLISGFSDGATYALGIGLANGDLFSRVVAYSPGFLLDVGTVGKPPILMAHGVDDVVLPIEGSSRAIVPILRELGYEVDYREFDGPHAVPSTIAAEVTRSLGAVG